MYMFKSAIIIHQNYFTYLPNNDFTSCEIMQGFMALILTHHPFKAYCNITQVLATCVMLQYTLEG